MTTPTSSRMGRRARRWRVLMGNDTGTAAVELAAAVGIWVLAVVVVATVYQLQASSDGIAHAAGQAARAASMTGTPADADITAEQTARNQLTTGPCEPDTVRVRTDVSDFRAGGTVRVVVTCRVDALVGPARMVSRTAEEVIDRYRGGL